MARDQLESYTAAPGHLWWDGSDENPEVNDDVDEEGNVKMPPPVVESVARGPSALASERPSSPKSRMNMTQTAEDHRKDYVPVTQLKRYPVEEDEYTLMVGMLRLPGQGLLFELVMPEDRPRHQRLNDPSEVTPVQAILKEPLSL